jgi:hypothetical protein
MLVPTDLFRSEVRLRFLANVGWLCSSNECRSEFLRPLRIDCFLVRFTKLGHSSLYSNSRPSRSFLVQWSSDFTTLDNSTVGVVVLTLPWSLNYRHLLLTTLHSDFSDFVSRGQVAFYVIR